ncbi:MAG: hypothetical protein WBH60_04380 [Fervidobacterium sp.]
MAEMPVLQGKGISMKFGEALVLDSVDVEFYPGKVYGLVGTVRYKTVCQRFNLGIHTSHCTGTK